MLDFLLESGGAEASTEAVGQAIGSSLETATSVLQWVTATIGQNPPIIIVFGLGILIPAAIKAFKKLSKVAK